jgi:hypothetical protein
MSDIDLPKCGLYRTTLPHPTNPDSVGSNRLVHFHNHSKSGKPIVLMPKHNEHNVWTFHDNGVRVDDAAWCYTLEPVAAEGLYVTQGPMQTTEDRVIPEGQLVQLGYNGNADPILFFPTKASSANALLFPDKGVKVDRSLISRLTEVRLSGPRKPAPQVN